MAAMDPLSRPAYKTVFRLHHTMLRIALPSLSFALSILHGSTPNEGIGDRNIVIVSSPAATMNRPSGEIFTQLTIPPSHVYVTCGAADDPEEAVATTSARFQIRTVLSSPQVTKYPPLLFGYE